MRPKQVVWSQQVFSEQELQAIEADTDALGAKADTGALPPQSVCRSFGSGGGDLHRTKYFFGALACRMLLGRVCHNGSMRP